LLVRNNWLIAAVVIGVVSIVVAAVAMRLSDDGPPTTEEWAGEVCTSLSDWRDSLAALADVDGESPTADSLRDRLDAAEDATSELVASLRELGAPELTAGDDLEAELDAATGQLESSFDALSESVERAADAPAGDVSGALADVASEAAALQALLGETVTTLRDADVVDESKAELQAAFADAPSCQSLQADS
jgi:hypothetical protein